LRLSDYRRQLAVVFQSIVLFSDTVRANVAFGQVDQVDDVAILAALEGGAGA
jgi:ABC-type multidrug transport system fused ATPase/permease subunit